MIFVDTDILIDILTPGQQWRDWSLTELDRLGRDQPLTINSIVLAELASGFPSLAESTAWLAKMGIEVRTLTDEAVFGGGLAFRRYRSESPKRTSVFADFLIGAHAAELEAALLTRDARLYRRYFPELTLLTPETQP